MKNGTDTPRLSRDLLVETCIRLADEEGPEAVTLRRIGAEIGVDPTAVYRHFRDKDELLAATADRLLTDAFRMVELTGRWKEDMRALALQMRRAYLTHPRMALLILEASAPLANEARITETGLAILRGGGFPDAEAVTLFETIEAYTLGVSFMDGVGSSIPADAWRVSFAGLPEDEYPNLVATASLLYRDPDARFEEGLDLLLDGIEARRSRIPLGS